MMHEITIRISLTPGRVRAALLFLLLIGLPRLSATQDEPQLWSYFPPPTAVFNTIVAGNGAVGANPLELARDYGNVTIGNPNSPNPDMRVLVRASRVQMASPLTLYGRKARLVVNGKLRVNGCIYLKNGAMGSTGWDDVSKKWGSGNFDPNSFWRCIYSP